ncbi:NBR1-Ig-like domain-containing protein [Paenibacillus assamensis]|uniref:NBR1-Ig-like domain-containing protein n=1 Tax=Paenibacillus assamensis TaxID=311244 RepID=UPI000407816B|nr:NBR1-Ig-like domain-containing protein [Paenibacillus assamensis]
MKWTSRIFSTLFILFVLLNSFSNTAQATISSNILTNGFEPHDNDSMIQIESSHWVEGYYSGIQPEGSVVPTPDWYVSAKNGSYFYRIAGTDTSSTENSNIYFKPYDNLNLKVVKGMHLGYWVYHYSFENSKNIAVDLIFDDGTSLRDSGAKDQHGNSVHPAYRNMPLNQWHWVEVNLDAFQGKTIKKVLIAYDDRDHSLTGQFRGYIDDLYIGPKQKLDAEIVSYDFPKSMYLGEEYEAKVTVRNVGSTSWSEQKQVRLGAIDDQDPFAIGRHPISGGQEVGYASERTFVFRLKAPDVPGTYTTDWRMVQDGVTWFGDSLKQVILVKKKEIIKRQSQYSYFYNANNLLTHLVTPKVKREYRYDQSGNMVSVSTSRNLVANHGFEHDDLWHYSPHMKLVTSTPFEGKRSIKFESNTDVHGTATESYLIPVIPSQKYVLKGHLFNQLQQGNLYLDVLEKDIHNEVVVDGGGIEALEKGKWVTGSHTFVTNKNTVYINVRVVVDGNAKGIGYADNLQLERVD